MDENRTHQRRRIVLAVETRLLREMLRRAVTKSPFLQVVGEVSDGQDLTSMVEETKAHWVFMSLPPDGKLPKAAMQLLEAQPSVSIIGMAPDGGQVKLAWTEPLENASATGSDGGPVVLHGTEYRQRPLGNLSLGELISVLRKGALWELAVRDVEGVPDVGHHLSKKE